MAFKIFIDGEAGTTGLKVAERLQAHPHVQLLRIDDKFRKDNTARVDMMAASDITILCLPDDAAIEAAALAETVETKLIDASSAHRTAAGWVYGFPELGATQRQAVATAHRISNPGCYPTGFLALARPLIAAGLLPDDALLTVPAVSGYSGGGKAMIAAFDGGDLPPAFSYGTSLKHKHLPEMTMHAGLKKAPIFMPSVGAFYAGMLVHLPLHVSQFTKAVTVDDLHALYADYYPSTGMVRMGAASANHSDVPPQIAADALAGRDHMEIFVFSDTAQSQFWLMARLDNLGKGASGAAVQNMNIALGLEDRLGLA
jgi:N-acetyl-gamma-glutamyl-phosphate reductase